MAEIARVNGDVLSGVNQNFSVGELVSFAGSQPVAFGIAVKNNSNAAIDLRNEYGAREAIEQILFVVLRRATITYMQIENDTSGMISLMVEANAGGWTAATLQAAIRDLGADVGVNDVDVRGTVVTDVGLKLAIS